MVNGWEHLFYLQREGVHDERLSPHMLAWWVRSLLDVRALAHPPPEMVQGHCQAFVLFSGIHRVLQLWVETGTEPNWTEPYEIWNKCTFAFKYHYTQPPPFWTNTKSYSAPLQKCLVYMYYTRSGFGLFSKRRKISYRRPICVEFSLSVILSSITKATWNIHGISICCAYLYWQKWNP